MNWYHLIRGYDLDPKNKSFYVSSKGELEGYEWCHFSEGKRIEKWTSRAWIRSTSLSEDGPPDDGLVNHFGLLVFSARMRIALESGGISGIQYLPIGVLKSNGTEHAGYSIANILNVSAALDRERSDFSVFPRDYFAPKDRGRISGIRKSVLKRYALESYHIIRLKDFFEAVYVSESLVDIYDKHKFTGYSFNHIELSP